MQTELRERLAKIYDVKDDKLVSVFGLRTQACLNWDLMNIEESVPCVLIVVR